jgi:hypothetical protein
MATIGDGNPTLSDVLAERNELWEEATVIEGNLETGHRSTQRGGLPSLAWRKLNKGVTPSKSSRVQIDDDAGMLEGYAEVDKKLANLGGNVAAFRASEDKAFIEAMNQEVVDTFVYGDTDTDPEKFLGISPRFDDLSAANADNVIDMSGSGSNNTSIYLIGWSPETVTFFYPKGAQGGLKHEDLGQVTLEDSAGRKYEGYRSHYEWDLGMSVMDWRYVVAIRNIDVSDLTKDAASGADLIDALIQALELIHSLSGVRPAFYVSRTIRSFLRRQIRNSTNVNLSIGEVAGKRAVMFDEVPVRRLDALLGTESQIT